MLKSCWSRFNIKAMLSSPMIPCHVEVGSISKPCYLHQCFHVMLKSIQYQSHVIFINASMSCWSRFNIKAMLFSPMIPCHVEVGSISKPCYLHQCFHVMLKSCWSRFNIKAMLFSRMLPCHVEIGLIFSLHWCLSYFDRLHSFTLSLPVFNDARRHWGWTFTMGINSCKY